jgi:hypothetical protein
VTGLVPFFSHTGTKRNLAAARKAGFGILVSAAGQWADADFELILADNGQWAERDNPEPFKRDRFLRFLEWLGDRALAIVLPDIVCGGLASLELTLAWLEELRGHASILLIAVQNGMVPAMIAPFVGPRIGLFVGGDDEWKEASMEGWGFLAQDSGCYLHIGRANTMRRIWLCGGAMAHSFDGTSATMFADTIPLITRAAAQADFAKHWRSPNDRSAAGFARRCREIIATMPGHPAHRALDLLTNDILREHGFGAGVDIFEAAVKDWHATGLPYPLIDPGHV